VTKPEPELTIAQQLRVDEIQKVVEELRRLDKLATRQDRLDSDPMFPDWSVYALLVWGATEGENPHLQMFYIGSAHNLSIRILRHLSLTRSERLRPVAKWLKRQPKDADGKPLCQVVVIMSGYKTEEDARAREREEIIRFRKLGAPLLNIRLPETHAVQKEKETA
jgi:hypothetical protein